VTNICDTNDDCSSNGFCSNHVCSCNEGFSGTVCQTKDSLFSPRERHAVAYDSTRDEAFVIFGYNWDTSSPIPKDMLIYNFFDKAFSIIDQSNWLSAPSPRYDHEMWHWNDSLVLFGGRNETDICDDMWIYMICTSILISDQFLGTNCNQWR
jgi:hypothetical protein